MVNLLKSKIKFLFLLVRKQFLSPIPGLNAGGSVLILSSISTKNVKSSGIPNPYIEYI